jgi:hypothetical protein
MFKNSIVIFLLIFHSVINIGILITLFSSLTAYILTISFTLFCILFILYNKFKIETASRKEFITITIIYVIITVKYSVSSINIADFILLFSSISLFYLVFTIHISKYIDIFFRLIVKLNVVLLIIFYLNIGDLGYLILDTSDVAETMFFGLSRFRGIFGTSGYASFVLCLTLFYFFYLQIYSNKSTVNLIYITIVLILGFLTGNRSFILGVILGSSVLFFGSLKKFRLGNLLLLISFLSILAVLFSNKLDVLYNYFSFRFDDGFENRLSGETGVFLLLSKLDIETLVYGALQNVNDSSVIVLGNTIFKPHNGLLYYLSAFGISVTLLLVFLYYDAALVIFRNKQQITYRIKFVFFIMMVFFSMGEAFLLTPINIILIKYFFEQNNNSYNG